MNFYTNCIAHNASEGQLLVGSTHAALIDCGMAFCADETIRNVKNALGDRTLDYIFLTHTHYDHVGALPYFRREWPRALVVTSELGAAVLLKSTPRRVIRELSEVAAKAHGQGADLDATYRDDAFHADRVIKEGEELPLGDFSVTALETPGHTRDSLCYYIAEMGLLMLNETPGVLMPDGVMYPCYLTGYEDTQRSIEKCRRLPYATLTLPHRGIADSAAMDGFFDKAAETNAACRRFILAMRDENLSEESMLERFYQQYATDTLLTFQPREAFFANARATIACTLRG